MKRERVRKSFWSRAFYCYSFELSARVHVLILVALSSQTCSRLHSQIFWLYILQALRYTIGYCVSLACFLEESRRVNIQSEKSMTSDPHFIRGVHHTHVPQKYKILWIR